MNVREAMVSARRAWRGAALLALVAIGSSAFGCGGDEPSVPVAPVIDPALVAYVELLVQAEQKTQADPRTMLAMMRQLYYGQPWSATSQNALWKVVIPCSLKLDDPHVELGNDLFDALASRAETGGVDVGHVFAGLETMVCPTLKTVVIDIPSEDFATWGGDLGAAVAAHAACAALGADALEAPDCGAKVGGQPLDFYLQHHAPSQDMEGDLDPFAMRAILQKNSCVASRLKPLVLDRPLSELLGDYYLRPSSELGQARQGRDRCMLELLGGTFDGKRLTNRGVLVDQTTAHIFNFAKVFYLTIRNVSPLPAENDALRADARTVSESFIDGLHP